MDAQKRTKSRIGIVRSNAMQKSVTVMVERTVQDERFKKYRKRRNTFMAHDERNECQVGDTVRIRECRPLSKNKRWRVESILSKAKAVDGPQQTMNAGELQQEKL